MIMLNKKGMSIVEVMIGATLVTLLAAAIVGIGSMVGGSMQKAQRTQDEFNIANQIRNYLASEQSCRLALGGPKDYQAAAATSPYSKIVAPNGQTTLILYQPLPVNAGRPVFLDTTNSGTRSFNGLTTNLNIIGNWMAQTITIEPETGAFAANGYFPALLRVGLKPQSETTTLGSMNIPPIRLTVQLDNNLNIVSCFPANYATDATPIPICPPFFAPNTMTDLTGVATASGPYLACRRVACDVVNGFAPIGGWDRDGNILCSAGATCPMTAGWVSNGCSLVGYPGVDLGPRASAAACSQACKAVGYPGTCAYTPGSCYFWYPPKPGCYTNTGFGPFTVGPCP